MCVESFRLNKVQNGSSCLQRPRSRASVRGMRANFDRVARVLDILGNRISEGCRGNVTGIAKAFCC